MSTVRVLFEIPDWVRTGLEDGTLVRESAGIVRRAAGTGSGAGSIVAHLRDVSPGPEIAWSAPASPFAATLQIFTLLWLDRRLERLERLAYRAEILMESLVGMSERILDRQALAWAGGAAEGIEFLQRYQTLTEPAMLVEAACSFVKGTAGCKFFLNSMSAEQMVAEPARTRLVMDALETCAAGELTAGVLQGVDVARLGLVMATYRDVFGNIAGRLRELPGSSRRMPTLEALRAVPGESPDSIRRSLIRAASDVAERLDAERSILEGLDASSLRELRADLDRAEMVPRILCVMPACEVSGKDG